MMSDTPTPESETAPERSGGVDVDSGGGTVSVGRDVIGRDRVSIHAAAGATIVVGGEGGLPLPRDIPTERSVARVDWAALRPAYVETFDWPDALADVWRPRRDARWTLSTSGGVYRFANTGNPSDVKYLYLRLDVLEVSDAPVSVEVKLDETGDSHISAAGLLYRFDRESNYYYAFVQSADGQCIFYRRNDKGFKPLYAGRTRELRDGAFNRLGIVGNGASLGLYVNDRLFRTIENVEFRGGDTGVIAMSSGDFAFDNFAVYV